MARKRVAEYPGSSHLLRFPYLDTRPNHTLATASGGHTTKPRPRHSQRRPHDQTTPSPRPAEATRPNHALATASRGHTTKPHPRHGQRRTQDQTTPSPRPAEATRPNHTLATASGGHTTKPHPHHGQWRPHKPTTSLQMVKLVNLTLYVFYR
ncbi:hypothetical protein P7K49_026039 [Saguinus oedipus]|uniref:Uncharacterized protein n=1 Tax=Saguinus oedipus TaxID=9490 RepID=A0ABQ9UJR2_SAGOE|nr:hypothetical protein P7K49_026039 [Saguinus oedipus]